MAGGKARVSLNGKVVLVTGGARRIGRGIALRLAMDGAKVAIHYQTSEAEARQTSDECGGAPLFRANLESVSEIERMFSEIDVRLGPLYGLVNNVFDARYSNYGTYVNLANANSIGNAINFTDARTITPAAPFAAYGGIKIKF